ncbi:MAG: DMT family transporter [Candidatus Competibacterales bacterium]
MAAILNATTPLFSVILAHVLTGDEKLTPGRFLGVLMGVAGVSVMVGGEALGSLSVGSWAQLACLASALSYALAGLYGRRFKTLGISPLATATGQVTASSVWLLPLVVIVDRPWTLSWPGLEVWGTLVGVASLSTALAYLLYFRLLATAGATNLLLVTLLIPVSATGLGVGILGEVLLPRHLVGMGLIAAGLLAMDGRLVGRVARRRPRPARR